VASREPSWKPSTLLGLGMPCRKVGLVVVGLQRPAAPWPGALRLGAVRLGAVRLGADRFGAAWLGELVVVSPVRQTATVVATVTAAEPRRMPGA
jgi:hypothetical protein